MKVLIAVDGTRATKAVLSTYSHLLRPAGRGGPAPRAAVGGGVRHDRHAGRTGARDPQELSRRHGASTEIWTTGPRRSSSTTASKLAAPGTIVKSVVRAGRPADEILAVAAAEEVDLVILGASGKNRLDRLITGSVAKEVEQPGGCARTPGAQGRGLRRAVQLERRAGRHHGLLLCRGRAFSLEIFHLTDKREGEQNHEENSCRGRRDQGLRGGPHHFPQPGAAARRK